MKNIPIIDLHQDLLAHIRERELFANRWQTNFEMLEESPVRVVIATAFPSPPHNDFFSPINNELIEADLRAYSQVGAEHGGWDIIRNLDDITAIPADAKGRVIVHIEGLNTLDNQKWKMLERWYELGWRSAGLVWNLTNSLGGGTQDTTTGLTPLGREVLQWLEQHHMIIDLAHMNQPTFWGAIKAVRGPVWASHTNARAITDHPRNLTDDQMKAVAACGGVVGVTFIGQTIHPQNPDLKHLIKHIDHMREVIGIDHIALGTDLGGVVSGLVTEVQSVTVLQRFIDALADAGYAEQMIAKICYQNAERFIKDLSMH